MSIGRTAPYPDYTFTGDNKNIPIIFSGKTLEKFYASTVLSEIANTDYLGEIKNVGDKVIIRTVPSITISDYVKGQKLDLEHPESPAMELTIDYAKYFNFALDDIDIKQFDIAMMDKWADDAAQQMKIAIETAVLGSSVIYDGAEATYNKGNSAGKISASLKFGASGAPLILTKDNILDTLIDVNLCLDEQNIPQDQRYVLLPAWAIAMIKKSDLKDASLTGDATSTLRTGRIGTIDGLTIYNSNLISTTTDGSYTVYRCIAGHKMGFAFVMQLTKVETYRPQDTFADAMKGLNVYGFGVVQDSSLISLLVAKG